MRVIIAPDSFKGSIGAAGAAAALAQGWRAGRPADEVTCLPLADGGEGTLDVLAAAVGGARWHPVTVTGPVGEPVNTAWLELPGRVAVAELARCSGLPLLARPDPMAAHTTGLGEAVAAALRAGAAAIMIGLGGSASTDGGTGALAALGARFLDLTGAPLPPGGGALHRLAAVDLTGLAPLPAGGVTCLTDVTGPLLGPRGAAAVFGPQKGAGPAQVAALESGLRQLASLLGGDPELPGGGAAGGTGYGLAAGWGAAIARGAPELCRLAGFDAALAGAGLVITGEGQYDPTSATGKVTGTVIAAAAAAGVPCALVAGRLACEPPVPAVALAALAGGVAGALADPARWLRAAGHLLATGPQPVR
jgi:glycerate 2-kinase